jgi:hypothetical protein
LSRVRDVRGAADAAGGRMQFIGKIDDRDRRECCEVSRGDFATLAQMRAGQGRKTAGAVSGVVALARGRRPTGPTPDAEIAGPGI